MRLIFAKPTYGPPPDPLFDRSHRLAMMYAANRGVSWAGDLSPDRMGWAVARNQIFKEALETVEEGSADGVFWVDDDVKVPIDTVVRLLSHQQDLVSGLYFQRSTPFWPVFANLNTRKKTFEWGKNWPEGALIPCDGVGFGCLFTSAKLLKAVRKLVEFPFAGDFGKKTYGEDFTFCLWAGKAGFKAHVDTNVRCLHHMGPEFADEALFRRFAAKLGEIYAPSRHTNPKGGGGVPQEEVRGNGSVRP